MSKLSPHSCSIGIVTYLARFETYFKPLIRKLYFLFPDYDINVFINGHYDTVKQIQYLRDVTCFLRKYPSICYVTNWEHQSLARGWNWLVLMARCERVIILNDDISFSGEFRHQLERRRCLPEIFTFNGSFSHFVISKEIIRKVGWFDERFLGVGDEDSDYICRLARKGIPLGDVCIHGLHNYVASPDDPSWAQLSSAIHGKYSQINRDFLMKKWWRSDYGPVPQEGSFKVRYHEHEWDAALNAEVEEMPEYYPMECLQASDNAKPRGRSPIAANLAKICSLFDHFYCSSRRALRACYQWARLKTVGISK
jgi:hypothetical protein